LEKSLDQFLDIPAPFGLTVRYAMKANPTRSILQLFESKGAHIDASTFNEVVRAQDAGIPGHRIRLTSQEVQTPERLDNLRESGVKYTACSLSQLDTYGSQAPGSDVGIRFNVGIGSGWNAQTSTGGENSSFGIYGHREEINDLLLKHGLTLKTVHLHIGSGSDPAKQREAIRAGLDIVRDYPSVTTINMGGGFKVARMTGEKGTNIAEMGRAMRDGLTAFEEETGRRIRLEVEPGTALVANAGYILTEVVDVKDTGVDGKNFLVVNGGMNMNARPALYAAQHPLYVVSHDGTERDIRDYAVVGINCESGDLLTPQSGDAERVATRPLLEAHVGDLLIIGGAGAYTSGMALEHYNSQQAGREVMVDTDGTFYEVRQQEPVVDIWRYERDLRSRK
jgi:diaminopimelate decarboxylase